MSSRAQKLKSIVKGVESKPTFGTNPMDPWSAKAGISESESGLLKRYLLSRGIDPRYVTKDTRISHAKSGQFLKWKSDHVADRTTNEEVDKKDTITFDIPLLIRVLEFAREDLKSDVNLHKMVERLISMRGKGTLTMNQYGVIVKEEIESERLDEISVELQHRYFKAAHAQKYDKTGTTPKATKQKRTKGMAKVVSRTLKRNVLDTPGAAQDFKDQEKKRGIGHVRDHVETEGEVMEEGYYVHREKDTKLHFNTVAQLRQSKTPSHLKVTDHRHNHLGTVADVLRNQTLYKTEAKEANYGGDYQATVLRMKEKASKKPVDMKSLAARMQAAYAKDEKKPVKENMEPLAACAQPGDGANTPDDVAPKDKNKKLIQMSKSARIIKSIYKRKGMSEETLDETWKYHTYGSKEEASAARNAHHSWRDDKGMASGNPARLVTGNRVAYKGEFKGPKPMKEELYDHEKEDKSTAPLGKKPKVNKMDKDAEPSKSKIQAAAVLSGGTTLTGQSRDTVEIDPIMRVRPGQPDPTKNEKK